MFAPPLSGGAGLYGAGPHALRLRPDVNIVEAAPLRDGEEKPSRGHMSAVPLPGDNGLGRASCGVRLLDPETGKKATAQI